MYIAYETALSTKSEFLLGIHVSISEIAVAFSM